MSDKMNKLTRYQADIQSRLSDLKTRTPEKHKNRPREFKQHLENELKTVTAQIEKLRLESK